MQFQKSPLTKIETPNGWCIYQEENGEAHSTWSKFNGKHRADSGEAAKAILKQSKENGAWTTKIPNHYLVVPTGLDLQVHLRFPGQAQKETLEGGLESALLGGYDSLVTMPNTNPYLDDASILQKAIHDAGALLAKYPVRVGFTAAGTRGMQGEEKTDIAALAKAGAVAITDDGWGVKSPKAMADIFAACAENDLMFQQHAEMPGHRGVATASKFQASENLPAYPRNAESEMIRRDIEILKKTPKARYHVLHVSTRESLTEIKRAKEAGLFVTAEVTPHHLFFANSDIPAQSNPFSTAYKMNPPLFDPEDREALIDALATGLIDCVSTDHAPHEAELKAKGWLHCPFGTRGMETALPALLTLMNRGRLTLERVVEVFHSQPRRILAHSEFATASGWLFLDPSHSYEITRSELPGISQNSCFLGATLQGRIEIRAEAKAIYRR